MSKKAKSPTPAVPINAAKTPPAMLPPFSVNADMVY